MSLRAHSWFPFFAALCLLAALPAAAQFTGQRVACDRRYPTDTSVPSKYGTQVIASKGSHFLAGPCGIQVTAAQLTFTLSTLYNRYTYANTTCNGYRLTVVQAHAAHAARGQGGASPAPTCAPASSLIPHPSSLPRAAVSIAAVAVDPRTHLAGFDASRITFAAGYVQVNLAGLTFGLHDRLVLDVTFTS